MDIIKKMETLIGGRWVGVAFQNQDLVSATIPENPVRFCEAISKSATHPLLLSAKTICCAGGRRSLGWSDRNQDELVKAISDKSGMSGAVAFRLVAATPGLRNAPDAVTVGTSDDPDVVISYGLPESVMTLVRRIQEQAGENISMEVSSVMSVCGNVAVRAHLTGRACISFGCMDSREATGMGKERLIVGIPKTLYAYFSEQSCDTSEVSKAS